MDYTEMSPEQLHGSALAFLLEGDDEEAAAALARCTIERVFQDPNYGNLWHWILTVHLRAPRAVYSLVAQDFQILNEPNQQAQYSVLVADNTVAGRIRNAFTAVIAHGDSIERIDIRAQIADVGDRHMLADLISQTFGGDISNQAPLAREARFWEDLRFRSQSEIKIAEALDEARVMFFPLCRGRVTLGKQRVTREPDFLVCHQAKWGILEVDGEPFHPATRTTQDHERDRLFRSHGIRVVEHFDSKQCYEYPKLVVGKFLEILAKNG